MKTYVVTFVDGRVGRTRGNAPLEVTVKDDATEQAIVDTIAEAVFRYAKKKLASKWFDVATDLEHGSIEAGRFGSFSVAVKT